MKQIKLAELYFPLGKEHMLIKFNGKTLLKRNIIINKSFLTSKLRWSKHTSIPCANCS